MKSDKKKRAVWATASASVLCIEYVVLRYLLFDLHGMKQLPLILFAFGLIVICISEIINGKQLMICTVSGFIISFLIGARFKTDWVDSHGTAMDNLWVWFTLGMLAFVLVGVILEIMSKVIRKNSRERKNCRETQE